MPGMHAAAGKNRATLSLHGETTRVPHPDKLARFLRLYLFAAHERSKLFPFGEASTFGIYLHSELICILFPGMIDVCEKSSCE